MWEELRSFYNTVAAGRIEQYVYYHLPVRSCSLEGAPEDGPMRKNYVGRTAFFLQHCSGRKHRTVRVLPLNNPLMQLKRRS
jgi:hypothetical protein